MLTTKSSTRRSRHRLVRTLAFGVIVSLSPLAIGSSPVGADTPAVSVTGLARGARGDAVKAVQQALVNQGVAVSGGVDGIFGAGTEEALKSFQKAKGIAANGVVDGATALALGLASSPLLGLTQGNQGDNVKTLQQRLISAGISVPGGADGVFGSATLAALQAYQRSKGLAATTSVDVSTAASLGSVSSSASTSGGDSTPAATASGSSSIVGLKIGARSNDVKTLQQLLIAAGVEVVGGADGIFGVLTANALSSFQNSQGLTANAVVDEATAAALAAKAPSSSGQHDPAAGSPLVGLKYGATGSNVKQLQQAIIDAGVAVRGGADGVFGTATRGALEEYQRAKGLSPSGVVDEATASALGSGQQVSGGTSPLVGLKAGTNGVSVKELQSALIKAGINVRGGADGIFGPATANAVKDFQKSQGLDQTGVADAATVAALASPKAPVASGGSDGGGYAAYGEKGARVNSLQSALVKAGISLRGGVDGDFGSGTSAAVMDFQSKNGIKVTGKVDAATAAALGLGAEAAPTAPDPASVKMDVFPVQGKCYYGDSYGYTRGGGRTHLGVDIIAAEGQLLYAVADGKITKVYHDYPGSLSGNAVRLTTTDGTYFFYAHMSSIADGIDVGVPVKAGQIVGHVGTTGSSGTNHLHFEIHPQGGATVNPYPLVKAIDACSRTEPLPQP